MSKTIDNKTLKAIVSELQLFRFAMKHCPEEPIGRVKDCACIGPMPECECIKRERLVKEFLSTHENKG